MDGDQALLKRPLRPGDLRRVSAPRAPGLESFNRSALGAPPPAMSPPAMSPPATAPVAMPPARPRGLLYRDLSDAALRAPPPITYSRDDLAEAERDGYRDGYAAAHAEAAQSRAAAETAALAAVASAMQEARGEVAGVAERTARAFAKLALAAMRATMPELMRRHAHLEISALVAEVLPGLAREPAIRVEVAPALAPGVGAKLASIDGGASERIVVVGCPGLPPGDVRIAWSAGRASREPSAVWGQVLAAFDEEGLDADAQDGATAP